MKVYGKTVTGLGPALLEFIRIYHKCKDDIEKSVLKITDWHHEAC